MVRVVIFFEQQSLELARALRVGAFSDHEERGVLLERLRDVERGAGGLVDRRAAQATRNGECSDAAANRFVDWLEPLLRRESYLALLVERPAELDDQKLAMRAKNLKTEVAAPDIVLPADFEKLRVMLDNLVSNAVTYSEAGSRVLVSTKSVDDTAQISVVDQGIGIDAGHGRRVSRTGRGGSAGVAAVRAVTCQHDFAVGLDDEAVAQVNAGAYRHKELARSVQCGVKGAVGVEVLRPDPFAGAESDVC